MMKIIAKAYQIVNKLSKINGWENYDQFIATFSNDGAKDTQI